MTPTTKEPKICHALATTSAFNLKLCLIETLGWTLIATLDGPLVQPLDGPSCNPSMAP